MDDQPAIVASNVLKEFKLPHEKHSSLKSLLLNVFKRRRTYERHSVLRDISFEIKKGEFFGIVGRNGSGKSTLLKLIAGIYTPDSGEISLNGKLTPFIELGVGFNPELTGRENIFLNGALLGFSTAQMEEFYDEIVSFAELERFMDQKLKNYSSGMQVRLAFSIAIKARNDILIFDEVLAVGDEAFQRKCLDVFEKYKAEGQTVVLVTHDMEIVRKFCKRAMLIDGGELLEIGDPRKVAEKYSKLNQAEINKSIAQANETAVNSEHIQANILGEDLKPRHSFNFGEKLTVDVKWHDLGSSDFESIGVSIFKQSGEHLTGINSRTGNLPKGWKDSGSVQLNFDMNILPGRYFLYIEMFKSPGQLLESFNDGLQFNVVNKQPMPWSGLVELPHDWSIRQAKSKDSK